MQKDEKVLISATCFLHLIQSNGRYLAVAVLDYKQNAHGFLK
jgi:hypothetical protein